MAKPIVFQWGDTDLSFSLAKIDRSKLYGYKEVKVLDEDGNRCELATLADDGRTVVARGGTGLVYVDADGCWSDKAKLKPIDVEGNEIQPVASSFSAPIKLFETASVDGDPEIDMETTGRFLSNTSRVYIDQNREIVHKVEFWEIVRNPDGSQRERRPRQMADPNLASELPQSSRRNSSDSEKTNRHSNKIFASSKSVSESRCRWSIAVPRR